MDRSPLLTLTSCSDIFLTGLAICLAAKYAIIATKRPMSKPVHMILSPTAFTGVNAVGLRIIWTGLLIGLFVAIIAYFAARQIASPVRKISEQLVKVSNGDLSVNVPVHNRQDEVGILVRTVRTMLEKLKAQTRDIMGAINVLASSSNQIATTTAQLASGSEQTY